ncbi:MFS transporter [Staphylococcus sp. 18_1_E_LY]|uniref:MFS transporter n=1 Tax=Staphylococcus lloydii TaxID=2781774 RepID=A0A7T1FA35_9STAP|nr:MFS transporter [Staphylococcus lloydii]MBF7019959.1 MFS transporter [Staphylococcus lloydii]MBF7027642.1 MFS transporter [Staphylococcus lloydii]QPM75325.1 MFS transporter [Staphylococcus lloydii]
MNLETKKTYYIYMLLIAILLVGATLRSPIASVGPLVPHIKSDLAMSNTAIGFMNTLPLIAFGLFSPLVPKIAAKLGIEVTLLISMFILSFGVIFRVFGDSTVLILGTLVVGIAISAGNVLTPSLIKSTFIKNTGFVVGLYSITMNLISALSSGLTSSIANSGTFDWKFAMQLWVIFPVLAIVAFFLRFPQLKVKENLTFGNINNEIATTVWKSKFAWAITLYMGLQSLIPYSLFAWLPQILETKGFNGNQAGWYMTIFQLAMLPINFIIPIITSKMQKQSFLTLTSGIFLVVGLLGVLLINNNWVIVFLVLIGLGTGATYSLAMMFFVLKTATVKKSSDLSGMAQSIGYILAASGPLLLGIISQQTGSWNFSIILLILVGVLVSIFGFISGKDTKI